MRGTVRGQAALAIFLTVSACQEPDEDKVVPKPPPAGARRVPPVDAVSGTSPDEETPPTQANRPLGLAPRPVDAELRKRSVPEQQAYLLSLLAEQLDWGPAKIQRARSLFEQAPRLGFGNPQASEPAMTQAACWAGWAEKSPHPGDPSCGFRNMVRLPGEDSRVCIDQFEFPNLVCEYPVVWVRSSEAALLCDVQGKRLCDAHEWEGACAGNVGKPDEEYLYPKLPKGIGQEYRRNRRLLMEDWHNRPRDVRWAYGSEKVTSTCGMASGKSPGCGEASYVHCGTNDYPAGAFPGCISSNGVYDQHGNVAEHMSFPLFFEELGGQGWTEMKGSWFIAAETHPDDCRWRAKNWHTTKISDPNSHNNYHLGFRCCADVP